MFNRLNDISLMKTHNNSSFNNLVKTIVDCRSRFDCYDERNLKLYDIIDTTLNSMDPIDDLENKKREKLLDNIVVTFSAM